MKVGFNTKLPGKLPVHGGLKRKVTRKGVKHLVRKSRQLDESYVIHQEQHLEVGTSVDEED